MNHGRTASFGERLTGARFFWILYILFLAVELAVLWDGHRQGLFGMPPAGTDQLTTLQGAALVASGHWVPFSYGYSLSYTVFLAAILKICGGNLFWMRLVQALCAAFIPGTVYRLSQELRLGETAAKLSGMLLIFYAPLVLISLDFLRAAILLWCFSTMLLVLCRAFRKNSVLLYAAAGILGGLTFLGRENMLPLLFMPAAVFIFPRFWKYLKNWKRQLFYPLFAVVTVCVFLTLNFSVSGHFSLSKRDFGGKASESAATVAVNYLKRQDIGKIGIRLHRVFGSYEEPNSLSVYAYRDLIDFMKLLVIPFHLLVMLALTGCILGRKRHLLLLFGIGAAGYLASLTLFFIYYRYRIPVLVLLAVPSGYALAEIGKLVRQKKWKTAAASLLFIGCGTYLLAFDSWKERTQNECDSIARILIERREYVRARDYLDLLEAHGKGTRTGEIVLLRHMAAHGEKALADEYFRVWRVSRQPKSAR